MAALGSLRPLRPLLTLSLGLASIAEEAHPATEPHLSAESGWLERLERAWPSTAAVADTVAAYAAAAAAEGVSVLRGGHRHAASAAAASGAEAPLDWDGEEANAVISARLQSRSLLGGLRRWLISDVNRTIHDFLTPPRSSINDEAPIQCNLEKSRCLLSDPAAFEDNQWTQVFPGGNTTCIDGSPYFFQAMRGDPKKLLIYFQGGGACWNQASTGGIPGHLDVPLCFQQAMWQPLAGVFSRSNPENPYADHTVVHLNYCSGDAHLGDVVRPYKTFKGNLAVQKGYHNTQAAVTWLQANGFGSSTLTTLTVMGCSAGSLGAQAWSAHLMQTFPSQRASVFADSYVGLFPPGKQQPVIRGFGMCGLPIFRADQRARCLKDEITVQDLWSETMADPAFRSVRFATINAKADFIQRIFYAAVDILTPPDDNPFEDFYWKQSGVPYYWSVNLVLQRYASASPNWSFFLVDGTYHCYTCYDAWGPSAPYGGPFWVGPLGQSDKNISNVTLQNWCGESVVGNEFPKPVCAGKDVRLRDIWVTALSDSYCYSSVMQAVQ